MNTQALNPLVLSTPRLLNAYWTETKYEFLRMLRNLAFGGPILLVPIGTYLLFAVAVAADGITKDPALADFLFAGFSVMAVSMPAVFSVGCILALERDQGLMKLKRAQPAPTGSWLVAKTATAMGFAVLAYLPILIAGIFVGRLTMSGGELAAMSAVLIAGSIPFAAIGLLIGATVPGSSAPGWANLFYLPCIYLAGLFIPLPKFMHSQTVIWPSFHLDQLALAAGGVTKFTYIQPRFTATVLIAITVVCGGLAIWRLARKG
jgi:ABC-2 type transport system permease protein